MMPVAAVAAYHAVGSGIVRQLKQNLADSIQSDAETKIPDCRFDGEATEGRPTFPKPRGSILC
jgi:hypothetical protein